MARKKKVNPNCSVAGCQTKEPHVQDKHVKDLLELVTNKPHVMAGYIAEGLSQLGNSACNDLANNNALGFIARQRQIQELHIRGLYLLLIAEPPEQAHMLSSDLPNGLSAYYKTVNDLIFHNQTDWEAQKAGLNGDTFTIMKNLHEGAHVSFKALLMAKGFYKHAMITPETFAAYIKGLLTKYKFIHGAFKSGKTQTEVLDGVQNLFLPASHWATKQKEAKEALENGSIVDEAS
jgi:hypothetical protein